jgi:deazaflavin-dependent oxidoreductase (nitroreductase family)
MADYNKQVIEEFRANHGQVGGNFAGAPLLLLHTTGAKSGQERVNPVMYLADGDRFLVFASKAGADTHPDWFHNLRANPDARIEVGDEVLDVRAEEVTGAERDEKYAEQAALYPGFADYERKTDRVIPVVALSRRSRLDLLRHTTRSARGQASQRIVSTAPLTSATIDRVDGSPVTVTTAQRPSRVARLRVSKPWMSPPCPHATGPGPSGPQSSRCRAMPRP